MAARIFSRTSFPRIKLAGILPSGYSREIGYSPQYVDEQMNRLTKSRDVCKSLQLFQIARSREVVPLAKSFASLLYLCHSCHRHEELDHWFQEMQQHYKHIGGGVRATLINSYCARQEWRKALEVLESLKAEDMLRHTRSYIPLIQGLAENGYTSLAFRLFREKVEHHSTTSHKDRQLISDSQMIVALVKSCFQERNTYEKKSKPKLHVHVSHKGDTKGFLSNDRDLIDVSAVDDDPRRYNMALEVFDFYKNSGVKVNTNALEAIKEWFGHDDSNTWKWGICDISSEGVCSKCGTKLASGIPAELAHQLTTEMLLCLSDIPQEGLPARNDKICEEFNKFQKFVKTNGPFDVIVDGSNVGFAGNNRSVNKTFYAQQVKETVLHFTNSGKKVLLLINHIALQKKNSALVIEGLEEVCLVFKNKHSLNDFDILYAAAYSGMGQVFVVTNDRLRDHRLLLSSNVKWTYLKWTRENCITVHLGQNGKLIFKRSNFDPVLQNNKETFHIPATDGTWRCVCRTRA